MIQSETPERSERTPAVRSHLARSLVCGALLLLVSASAHGATATLDWSTVVWTDGVLTDTYTLGNGVMVTITIASTGSGSFTSPSPNEDGSGASTDFFGSDLDLGIQFTGTGVVTITVDFVPAATDIAFEISDVDRSGDRIDEVVVACDGSAPTSFTAKSVTPTFSITASGSTDDTATGTSMGSMDGTGTVEVDCGASAVSTVLMTYSGADSSNRGIGVLFMLTETPVELMDFSVE